MPVDDTANAARSPDGNLGYLFRIAYHAFRGRLEDALAGHGLTVPEYSALSAFDARTEMSSAELARLLDVTPQTMNTVVHDLLNRALLRRQDRPSRGKTLLLRLSPRGRRVLDTATATVRDVERAALSGRDPRHEHHIKAWLSELAHDTERAATPQSRHPTTSR